MHERREVVAESTCDIRDIQLAELEILKAVAALCDKLGIRYYLYCGTLLGAIRHGGFIPWDDDIDIAMPLADYRRFLDHVDELPEGFVAQSPRNTPDAYAAWTKVFADGTTDMADFMKGLDVHKGLFIDVYPMIGAAKTRLGASLQSFTILAARSLRLGGYFKYQLAHGQGGTRPERIAKRVFTFVPVGFARKLSNALLRITMKDPERAQRVGTIDGVAFKGKFARADWERATTASFEGIDFPIPVAYDTFLRTMYGDYMQLPPEDKRHPSHDYEIGLIIDAHRDYREYEREMAEGAR